MRFPVLSRVADDAKWRTQVHVEHGVPLLVARLLDAAVPDVAGVVDQNVEMPEPFERGPDEALWKIWRCHAPGHTGGLGSLGLEFCSQGAQRLFI